MDARRVALVLALVLAFAACARSLPAPQGPREPARLAVVTWNMHAGAGDLQQLVRDLTAGRLSAAPPRDYVLLLQEASQGGAHDPALVAAARHLSIYYAAVRTVGGRTSGNAIVSTLPLSAMREISLPRARQPRSALEATIALDGQPLFIVDTHLENRISLARGGLFSDTARGRQAEALLREIPASGPGIAGGDFNTWLGTTEPAWRAFLARFHDTPAERSEPTFRNHLVLDHLFFDLPGGWRATRTVIRERYHSDHNPVLGLVTSR